MKGARRDKGETKGGRKAGKENWRNRQKGLVIRGAVLVKGAWAGKYNKYKENGGRSRRNEFLFQSQRAKTESEAEKVMERNQCKSADDAKSGQHSAAPMAATRIAGGQGGRGKKLRARDPGCSCQKRYS